MAITKDSEVTMHFDIRLKDGSIADSTRNIGKPITFKIGDGTFSPKLEEQLMDLEVGGKAKIMLMPEDAFGEPHPANVFQVPADKFKDMEGFEQGAIFLFTQPSGQEIPGLIRAIDEYEVTVDFNHPLSGQVILFDLEIVAIA